MPGFQPYPPGPALAVLLADEGEPRFQVQRSRLSAALSRCGYVVQHFNAQRMLRNVRRAVKTALPAGLSRLVVAYTGDGSQGLLRGSAGDTVPVKQLQQLLTDLLPAGVPKVLVLDSSCSYGSAEGMPLPWVPKDPSGDAGHDLAVFRATSEGYYAYSSRAGEWGLSSCLADALDSSPPEGISLTDLRFAVEAPMRAEMGGVVGATLELNMGRPFTFVHAAADPRLLALMQCIPEHGSSGGGGLSSGGGKVSLSGGGEGFSVPFSEVQALVLDCGSGTIKAGFAGDDAPRSVFPSIVGYLSSSVRDASLPREYFAGREALSKRPILNCRCPIERGLVTDWDAMERLWSHTFYSELRVAPEEHPVLLTEALQNPKRDRERMTQVMFETFNVPAMCVRIQPVLSMFANAGRTTGIVLESGDGVTCAVPIYEGYALPHAFKRLDFGGSDLTGYMRSLLAEKGHSFSSPAEQDTVRSIKEKLAYVAMDFEAEVRDAKASPMTGQVYKLPDGNTLTLGEECFRTPEALFQPQLMGVEASGIHSALFESITQCDDAVQAELYQNVVLGGAGTLFKGMAGRLAGELTMLAPDSIGWAKVRSPEQQHTSWTGGSLVASMSTFQQMWITKAEYAETGPSIVHSKCP